MKKKPDIPPKADSSIRIRHSHRPDVPSGGQDSRRQSKARLNRRKKTDQPLEQADIPRLIHKLQAHQIELETQNKELMRARMNAEEAYRQYTDLYDFAPVGYFTLTRNGTIREVNLAGANLLGVERAKLLNRQLGRFVSKQSHPIFSTFLENLLLCEGKGTCELAFEKKKDGVLWARLEATCFEGGDVCRAALTDITARKQVELALQVSEKRFRTLLQDVPAVAVQGYRVDGTTQYWNSASERLYGYSEDEAIGQNLLDLIIPPEMRGEVTQAIRQMAETGIPISAAELSLMRKDGSRVSVYSSHAVVSIPGREPELFCLDVDLTERKQAEESLRESEYRSRIVSDLTTDYIFVVDVDPGEKLKLRWVSDNLYRITGRKLKEVESLDTWGDIIHPEDRGRFFGFINQILSTAEESELECRAFYKNKEGERWIWILARPQVNEAKAVTTIIGAIKDITERKEAEEALRKSQEKFQAIADYTVDWESWFGTDGKYLWVNRDVEEITGYTAEEILAMPDFISTLVMDEDRAAFTKRFQEAIRGSRGKNFEFRYLHKNGATRWLSISWQPIYDVKGNPLGARASGRDVTERKQMEDELRHARESLTKANIELQDALTRQQQLAHTDALTGINNRRYLYELAEHEFEIAMRYKQPLSVMMIDLDHFKQVNDTFGHAVGDQILQAVTQVASEELRSVDVIGRYGGEEFLIVMPMTNTQQAYPLAERIRNRVSAIRVPTEKGDATVTLSIGIVEMGYSAQIKSTEDLFHFADEAMYAAKQAGRNQTKIATP